MPQREFEVVFYDNAESKDPAPLSLPLGEFVEWFTDHERTPCTLADHARLAEERVALPGGGKRTKKKGCPHKDGLSFSPGILKPNTTRGNKNVQRVTLLVYDLDHLTTPKYAQLYANLVASDLRFLLYSSHSYDPLADDWCLRLILFPSRDIKPQEFRAVRLGPIEQLKLETDPKVKDLSRLYFLPRAPQDAPIVSEYRDGAEVDVDAIIRASAKASLERSRAATERQPAIPEGSTDLKALRLLLQRYVRRTDVSEERQALVRTMLAGERLAEEGSRDDSTFQLASTCEGVFHSLAIPAEVAVELARPSLVAMDFDEDPEEWVTKFIQAYERARENTEEWRAEKRAEEQDVRRATAERMGWKVEPKPEPAPMPPPPPPVGTPAAPAPAEERRPRRRFNSTEEVLLSTLEDDEDIPEAPTPNEEPPAPESSETPVVENDDWENGLKTSQRRDGSFAYTNVGLNAFIVLRDHPLWRGKIRFNEVSKEIVVTGGPLPESQCDTTVLATNVQNWLYAQYELNLHAADVKAQLLSVAMEHSFDPLKDYLHRAATTWDGVARIDRFLETGCRARLHHNGEDLTEHVRKTSRRWFISAAARGLEPGCKVDTALILEGLQGVKKSTTFKALGGEFFGSGALKIGEKDSQMKTSVAWVIELAELTSFKHADVEQQKAFFSESEDMYRPPFAAAVKKFPRRCVFVGTTNNESFLSDTTGNRRYWVVNCRPEGEATEDDFRFDLTHTRSIRDQLWGEAAHLFLAGGKDNCADCAADTKEDRCERHRWWFTPAEERTQERINTSKLMSESTAEQIAAWWYRKAPESRPEFLRIPEVAEDVLKVAPDRVDMMQGRIGRALKLLGFERKKRMLGGIRVWVYEPNEELKEAPKVVMGQSRILSVIEGQKERANEREENPGGGPEHAEAELHERLGDLEV